MPVNATLLGMLACPSEDHAPLLEVSHDGVEALVCSYCATRYLVDDGIPVLLIDDATPGPNGVGVAAPPDAVEAPGDLQVAAEPVAEVYAGPLTVHSLDSTLEFDPRLSPKHALPDLYADPDVVVSEVPDAVDEVPDEVDEIVVADGIVEVVGVDDEIVEVAVVDDGIVEVVVAESEDEVVPDAVATDQDDTDAETDLDALTGSEPAMPTDPRRSQPAPARSSRAGELRQRVQQRLAELETNRGPRMRRRGSGR